MNAQIYKKVGFLRMNTIYTSASSHKELLSELTMGKVKSVVCSQVPQPTCKSSGDLV